MSAPTLVDFLLARIAEDEAAARAATPGPWYWEEPSKESWPSADESLRSSGQKMRDSSGKELEWGATVLRGWGHDASGIEGRAEDRAHIARHDPARVLAECAAKRRIVSRCDMVLRGREHGMFSEGQQVDASDNLRALASVYSDHAEFQEVASC